jgi:hypothetical protein
MLFDLPKLLLHLLLHLLLLEVKAETTGSTVLPAASGSPVSLWGTKSSTELVWFKKGSKIPKRKPTLDCSNVS